MKLTQQELLRLFVYDESYPTCLRWKEPNEYGCSGRVGYIPVSRLDTPFVFIYGARVAVAYIVWVMYGRTLHKGKSLSPKDGDLHNVRIGNLQEVVLYQNPL